MSLPARLAREAAARLPKEVAVPEAPDGAEQRAREGAQTSSALQWGVQKQEVMSQLHRITVSPGVCGGRPTLRGLRIRVRDVLDLLAAGSSRAEILADYPYLEDEDISAVLEFAARQTDHPVLRSA